MHKFYYVKKGFTLSEVLITLGIIGVVAALTLPILVQKYKKLVVENKLRRAYSIVSQAVKYAEAENGVGFWIGSDNFEDNDVNGFGYTHSEAIFEQYFKKYFKIIYTYNSNEASRKFNYYGYNNGNPSGVAGVSKAKCYKLIDGTALCYWAAGSADTMGYFYIYLEPEKKIKIAGQDVFSFEFNRTGGTYKIYSRLNDSYRETQRSDIIDGCTSSNVYWGIWPRTMTCSFLIWKNNFNIPDDYPIKF